MRSAAFPSLFKTRGQSLACSAGVDGVGNPGAPAQTRLLDCGKRPDCPSQLPAAPMSRTVGKAACLVAFQNLWPPGEVIFRP